MDWKVSPSYILTFFVILCGIIDDSNETRTRSRSHKGHRKWDEGCSFPSQWEGIWFQSTVRPYITIQGQTMSSKGTCVESKDQEKFILKESDDCYKCLVFHQRTPNVLQYKETFGCSPKSDLDSMCSYIAGDANLYSMFRVDGKAIACPFRGPLIFSYNRGKGQCSWPESEMESCVDPNKVVFNYQACPNVTGSEMMTEELECQALWKDGSYQYLVGKVSHLHATSDEDKFRCFVFQYFNPLVPSEGLYLAQSGDATCNGVFSPKEGPRTMVLKKAPSKAMCRFPRWLTSGQRWSSLDQGRSLVISAQDSNSSFISVERTKLKRHGLAEFVVRDVTSAVCHQRRRKSSSDSLQLILYQRVGCKTGYVCAEFHRKTDSVMSAKLGIMSRTSEYACDVSHFGSGRAEYKLLVADDAVETESKIAVKLEVKKKEQDKLPLTGLYSMANSSQDLEKYLFDHSTPSDPSVAAEVKVRDEVCLDQSPRLLEVAFGCHDNDMRVLAQCKEASEVLQDYTLVRKWTETSAMVRNDSSSLDLETESYDYLIFRPKEGRGDDEGVKLTLICFRFRRRMVTTKTTRGEHMLLTNLDGDCLDVRLGHNQEELAFKGDCSLVSSAKSVWDSSLRRRQGKLFIVLFNLGLCGLRLRLQGGP